MNPLDTANIPFKFEMRHVSAVGKTTKAGPQYRITAEVDKAVFDQFITANLDGACFAVRATRIDYDAPYEGEPYEQAESPKRKRHVSETELLAYSLPKDKRFQEWILTLEGARPETTAVRQVTDFIKSRCAVEHRRDIDKSSASAVAFGKIVAGFNAWKEGR